MEALSAEKRALLSLTDAEIRTLLKLAAQSSGVSIPEGDGKIALPDDVKTTLRRIEKLRDSGRNSPDEENWANYVTRIRKLSYYRPETLKQMDEKRAFREIIASCREHHLPDDFALEMGPTILEYWKTGRIKPILIHGPAGCGKTLAAIILTKIAGIRYYLTSATACDHRHGVLGEGGAYKFADIGELWRGILQTLILNPAFIFDEIDKISHSSEHLSIESEFLSILNDENRQFTDNYLGFPASLSRSIIIFTCNDIQNVSEPLKDRCMIYAFKEVPLERMLLIIEEYAADLIQASYASALVLNSNALRRGVEKLYQKGIHSVRQHKNLIENSFKQAYGRYLTTDQGSVSVDETIYMEQAERLYSSGLVSRAVGFSV